MARKNKRGNNVNKSKFKRSKPVKKRQTTFRDIKHKEQFKKLKETQRKKEERYEEESDSDIEEVVQVDPLQQLLSTFGENSAQRNFAIDSEDDEESNSESAQSENEDDDQGDTMDDDLEIEGSESEINEEEATEVVNKNEKSNNENVEFGEEEESEEEIDTEVTSEEVNSSTDPFNQHFNIEIHPSIISNMSPTGKYSKEETLYWPVLHNIIMNIPQRAEEVKNNDEVGVSVDKDVTYAKQCCKPELVSGVNLTKLHIKTQIHGNINKANKYSNTLLSPLQMEIFTILNNYQDLFYPEKTYKNNEEIEFAYCLHVVNHVLKTRLKILHHNSRLTDKNKQQVPEEFRDQGLVRPKVLILVPFRQTCQRLVLTIASILLESCKGNLINKSRFLEEFGGSELIFSKKNPKPEDYEATFKGNVDDNFRIGITVTKKSVKLYSDFYSSDIIIASPVGLRMVVGADGDKERDFDFLSSVEVLILDQAELFLVQNWDHLLHVMNHLHLQPLESHGTDFSRVRFWALNGLTKYFRQTILLSSIQTPELRAVFNRRCWNYAGKARVDNPVDVGTASEVIVPVPQVLYKFATSGLVHTFEDRFNFFIEKILPLYKDPIMNGVLIFIPSYFDFIRLRNYMKKEDFNFVQICEYTRDDKTARARDMFFHQQAKFLLYTERCHFYKRFKLKGIQHILFYQTPTFPHFYSELCNLTQETYQNKFLNPDWNPSVCLAYCKYDILQLSAVFTTQRASRLMSSDKNVHMFTPVQR